MTRKLFIKTYGCQMNEYDSARMAELLAVHGYARAASAEDAELVILNTCHIRERAEAKVRSELGKLGRVRAERRRRGQEALLAVAGCVAQGQGAELLRDAACVDLVFGPQSIHLLPDMVARAGSGERVLETEFEVERKFDELPETRDAQGPAAFLTVQEGCDRFCSFCVVPYTRGAEYSRPAADVIAEARSLAARGAREITLLGQNVNAYHGSAPDGGTWGLGRLIRALADALPTLDRLRYTTSHPRDMDDELIFAHRDVPQLMPFLHLPVQSGSDRILAAMGRRHTAGDYRRLVDRLRAARPDIALSSDFIAGFPGESEADFADTLALVDEIGFAQAYSFRYSARPGTPAAGLPDAVPESVKEERLARLMMVIADRQLAFNRRCIGQVMAVLLERKGRRPHQLGGRSPYMQAVHVVAPEAALGEIVDVAITAAHGVSLTGQLTAGRPVAAAREDARAGR